MNQESIRKVLEELNGGKASYEEKMAYLEELQQGLDAVRIVLDEAKANRLQKDLK